MIGVSSGTTSSRGVRTVSWKRRPAKVASGPNDRARAPRGAGRAMVDIDAPFGSGGRGERVAGEPQVDVVESRPPGADRSGQAEIVDGGDRLAGAAVVQRHRHARADCEGILARDPALAK